jgi:hypothetical protein
MDTAGKGADMKRLVFAPILCLLLVSVGCPSAPTGHSVVGLYEGYLDFDGTTVQVPAILNLFQDGAGNVTGTWTVDPTTPANHGGDVSGTVVGTTVSLTLTPTNPTDVGYTLACTVESWDETDDKLLGGFTATDSSRGYLVMTRIGPP